MAAVKLPFWFSEEQVRILTQSAAKWFELLTSWASWPLLQMNPETCVETVLNLIAWQRDIDRFKDEPLSLFRKRVKYAYINAKDAGSVAGFKRIFMRLDIGYVEIEERMDGIDWDIVDIQLSDSQLAENQKLLKVLIQHYGRTCRRYRWKIITPVPFYVRAGEFNNTYGYDHAAVPPCTIGIRVEEYSNDFVTL
ncbi:phage tail protein (plasmid) [Halodesulfovibrio aestuarii]|uniref:Phage tail protein (Tail_P2_I) n=1 Tax=Halodesulfovibrio aestuarii TaxID=126333 RepID=A0A8G2CC59_9BACT|nr:phage tail protein [Halodesulfovibrio aestuarii]SHJ72329.1 Phage tail protein (Tail_P2_I) [Halodesulfovibrio aestuarii]